MSGHFTQTEFRQGRVTATCPPCGWSAIASNHQHSVALGNDHRAEKAATARQAERDAPTAELGL